MGMSFLTIPISLKVVAGRKRLIEAGAAWHPEDDFMVQAVVRAFRWREMIDNGEFANAHDLTVAIGIGESYVSRMLRLTWLAPEIIHRTLEGTLPSGISLTQLHKFPLLWEDQKSNSESDRPQPKRMTTSPRLLLCHGIGGRQGVSGDNGKNEFLSCLS